MSNPIPERLRQPFCEHTAPGSTTVGIDCWAPAVVRYVNDAGITVAVFCEKPDHQPKRRRGTTVEPIINDREDSAR